MTNYDKLHERLHQIALDNNIRVDIGRGYKTTNAKGWEHNAYDYTVVWTKTAPAKQYAGTYRAGLGIGAKPQAHDILAAILSDASLVEYVSTPDEFGEELGYFPINSGADYRRLMDAFEECHKARQFMTMAFDQDYRKAQNIAQKF